MLTEVLVNYSTLVKNFKNLTHFYAIWQKLNEQIVWLKILTTDIKTLL